MKHKFENFQRTELSSGIILWQPATDILNSEVSVPQDPGCDTVYLGLPLGECGGVRMANQVIGRLSLLGKKVYGNHEPTHGADATQQFIRQGADFNTDIPGIPRGSTYVISAHGASPSVYDAAKAQDLDIYDVTCPLVGRTHSAIKRATELGASVAYISFGKPDHPEIVAAKGLATENDTPFQLVTNSSEADLLISRLSPDSKLAVVGQTTNNSDDADSLIHYLHAVARKKGIETIRPPLQDVCHTVRDRQHTAREIVAKNISSLIVVGSVNSKNTKSLAIVGAQEAYRLGVTLDIILTNSWSQLPTLHGEIGIVSGASTLEPNVENITKYLDPKNGVIPVGSDSDKDIVFKPLDKKTQGILNDRATI